MFVYSIQHILAHIQGHHRASQVHLPRSRPPPSVHPALSVQKTHRIQAGWDWWLYHRGEPR